VKEKEMEPASKSEEVFVPHFVFYEDVGMLQVIFLDRSVNVETVEKDFDVLKNSNPTSSHEPIVGFNLWGVRNIIDKAAYTKRHITLGRLLNLFEDHTFLPHGVCVFGQYRREVFAAAQEHPLIWEIPK
jgi:hypothetical protein